jgi:hypothetical protein
VSEKSTKPELWAAYNELLGQLEGRPAASASPEVQAALAKDPTRSLAELKLKMSQQLDALGADAQDDLDSLQDVRRQIQLERRRLLEAQRAQQDQLAAAMAGVRQQWQQEQTEHERQQKQLQQELQRDRQREEEEYRYSLIRTGAQKKTNTKNSAPFAKPLFSSASKHSRSVRSTSSTWRPI